MARPSVRLPIGISDFRELRTEGFTYIDKTTLIDDVLAEAAKVLLVPRPRRFGKTLNLSMLRYFFEKGSHDASWACSRACGRATRCARTESPGSAAAT